MILAHCKHCDLLFRSTFLDEMRGRRLARNMILENNFERCPRCGSMARVMDGVYDTASEVIQLISGPDITVGMYRRFAQSLEKARSGAISVEELHREAEQISPDFARATQYLIGNKYAAILILLLFMFVKGCTVEAKVDLNQLIEQLGAVVETLVDNPVEHLDRHQEPESAEPAGDGPGIERHNVSVERGPLGKRKSHLLSSASVVSLAWRRS